MKKALKLFGLLCSCILLFAATVHYLRGRAQLPPRPPHFSVISHRGVYQTFPPDGVGNDTCTARLIRPVTHKFIENTTPSMIEAFKNGAEIIEIDIHSTSDGHLVVFHDWNLDCRTEGHGVTHDHTLAELKKLDVGYGYTADGGKTFPLRGTGIGLMPSLDDVLANLPDQIFLINQKDTSLRTTRLLGMTLNRLSPGQRSRIFYLGSVANFAELHLTAPEVKRPFADAAEIKRCGKALLFKMGFGALPDACLLNGIALPARYLWLVPGWPNDFLRKTAASGVPVYVTEVNTKEDLEKLYPLPIHGIVTDRIEVVGPMLSPIE